MTLIFTKGVLLSAHQSLPRNKLVWTSHNFLLGPDFLVYQYRFSINFFLLLSFCFENHHFSAALYTLISHLQYRALQPFTSLPFSLLGIFFIRTHTFYVHPSSKSLTGSMSETGRWWTDDRAAGFWNTCLCEFTASFQSYRDVRVVRAVLVPTSSSQSAIILVHHRKTFLAKINLYDV